MKNANVQKIVKVVTIAGSAVLVLNSGMALLQAGTSGNFKGAIMPMVSVLVGIAAFNYAVKAPTLKVG
jgi:hypothetical protein